MILKALYDYYHRSGDEVAPFGMEYKEIGFLIVIDGETGEFLRFEDRRVDKKSAQQFLVRKSVGRSSSPVANYLYDNGAVSKLAQSPVFHNMLKNIKQSPYFHKRGLCHVRKFL